MRLYAVFYGMLSMNDEKSNDQNLSKIGRIRKGWGQFDRAPAAYDFFKRVEILQRAPPLDITLRSMKKQFI